MRISDWSSDVCSSDLEDEGSEATASDLVRLTGVDKAGVSRALASLGRRGLVSSATPATDARRVAVSLTRKGDRKSVVEGKSVSVRVDLGGRRIIKKKKKTKKTADKISKNQNTT